MPGKGTAMKDRQLGLRLGDALRVKSAELWLKLGQPVSALLELQQLPRKARGHQRRPARVFPSGNISPFLALHRGNCYKLVDRGAQESPGPTIRDHAH